MTTTNVDITRYEALIRRTASMIVDRVELDFDDICQRFRIKVWKALDHYYDPSRDRVGVDRFVFACLTSEKKDLLKRVKRNEAFIEDIAPDDDSRTGGMTRQFFEAQYLQESAEQAFHDVEEQLPFLPSTLSTQERQVVHFLYLDYDYGEISRILGIERKEVAPIVRGIREKMADWRPSASERASAASLDSNQADAGSKRRLGVSK